ncbi:uncharacterized protein LOC120290257 isoform X2 [Eucalyptus grandis]|uniref:uncharacterized protein LOC120290257 isoform X2 n=1 Tax=Eucalyptus grandis TaxID=71139 RepID=UPI00192E8D29|nr:uncharacterized protein LOC120290257 isoform X2 [Eucalyptus grandis]XP_039162030.1 uncharacterized protein LOC120290257 isoform X2 [Eucalyptus grandis]XP_039162032.1 uncharacterized protein LOC120290257 isoform X2 [Eucalyptus grandis]
MSRRCRPWPPPPPPSSSSSTHRRPLTTAVAVASPNLIVQVRRAHTHIRKTSRKGAPLQKDVPWPASSGKPIPKIHHSPVLRVSQTPYSNYAVLVTKHPDPIGSGLGIGAVVEAAGPDCIVPGQIPPVKLLGFKVW